MVERGHHKGESMPKLIPIAMTVPNKKRVYAPSDLKATIFVSAVGGAEYPKGNKVLVSFASDGVSNPTRKQTYRDKTRLNQFILG